MDFSFLKRLPSLTLQVRHLKGTIDIIEHQLIYSKAQTVTWQGLYEQQRKSAHEGYWRDKAHHFEEELIDALLYGQQLQMRIDAFNEEHTRRSQVVLSGLN